MHVGCKFVGEQSYSNQIWLYRTCWVAYEEAEYGIPRTAILLEAEGKGPYDWYVGVRIPKSIEKMTSGEKERRDSLIKASASSSRNVRTGHRARAVRRASPAESMRLSAESGGAGA